MPKPEWGVKRTCTSCRTRFYDLGRDPVVCPKCGTELDLSEAMKLRRAAVRAAPVPDADDEELIYGEEEVAEEIDEEEVEEGFAEDEDVPLALEDEDEEADEIPVPKKGGTEEDAELEDFDEDVLIEDDEEVDEDLEELDEDDDLKNV